MASATEQWGLTLDNVALCKFDKHLLSQMQHYILKINQSF
jgi:hypothetical protein